MKWVHDLYQDLADSRIPGALSLRTVDSLGHGSPSSTDGGSSVGAASSLTLADGYYIELIQKENGLKRMYYIFPWGPDAKVPVLYFNLYKDDQLVVSIDEIYGLVIAPYYQAQLKSDQLMMPALTQGDTPAGGPAFYLHPCNTPQLLVELQQDTGSDRRARLAWFNTAANYVNVSR